MLYYSIVVERVTDYSKSSPITFVTLIDPKASKLITHYFSVSLCRHLA